MSKTDSGYSVSGGYSFPSKASKEMSRFKDMKQCRKPIVQNGLGKGMPQGTITDWWRQQRNEQDLEMQDALNGRQFGDT
uniref:Gag polyprotein n=1 Tax=Panagrellus redivivus TaxID=6233 RepID=A0A7E4VR83_PANRE